MGEVVNSEKRVFWGGELVEFVGDFSFRRIV